MVESLGFINRRDGEEMKIKEKMQVLSQDSCQLNHVPILHDSFKSNGLRLISFYFLIYKYITLCVQYTLGIHAMSLSLLF